MGGGALEGLGSQERERSSGSDAEIQNRIEANPRVPSTTKGQVGGPVFT